MPRYLRGRRKKRSLIPTSQVPVPELKPALLEGKTIGAYSVNHLIGAGGFGKVYEAWDTKLQRRVAIKIYEIADEDAVLAFNRGASLLGQLDHPNIIKVFDFFTTRQYAAMVMELVEPSITLRQYVGTYCDGDKLSELTQILSTVLAALRHAHQSDFYDLVDGKTKVGIVHGDIKPENIFYSKGIVKLSDFMIPNLEMFMVQRSQSARFPPIGHTEAFGTPQYMSPEQTSGDVNEQTDIYSFGVTAFELLTGKHPIQNALASNLNERFSPEMYCPHSPHWLNELISKCILRDPSKRYKHVAEIEREIAEHSQLSEPQNEQPRESLLDKFTQLKCYQALVDVYDLSEIGNLCFTLSVDYDLLPGDTKATKARQLVLYCVRRNMLDQLRRQIELERPAYRFRMD